MFRYLKIYQKLIKFSAIRETTYRASFFLEILVEALYLVVSLVGIRVIFWNIKEVAGWNFYQMLVLLGVSGLFSEIVLGMAFIFNLRRLPEKIANGELDLVLTKPFNSQFAVSLWHPYFALIPSLIPGLALIFLGFNLGGFSFKPIYLFPFLIIFSSGLVIAYSLGMMVTTLSFWFINATPLPNLAEEIFRLSGRPFSIFNGVWRIFFLLFVPVAFMVSFPAKTLMGDFVWWWVPVSIFLAIIFLWLSSVLWRFGLKRYSSASS